MIFKVVAHSITEGLGCTVLNHVHQPSVRYKTFVNYLFAQNSAFMDILKNGKQHLLKTFERFVARNFVKLAVKFYFLVNVKNHFFGIARL